MKNLLRLATLIAVLVQAVPLSSLAGETYWMATSGRVAAFSLDLQTFEADLVMQGAGASGVYVYAVAAQPGTGILWVFYSGLGHYGLGTWPHGASAPTAVAPSQNYIDEYYAYDLEFSPTGTLYGVLYSYQDGLDVIGTIDLTTGAVTEVLSFLSGEGAFALEFHPIDGTLYFAGVDATGGTNEYFVDTLSIPGHQRARVWDDSNETATSAYAYNPLFDSAGDFILVAYKSGSNGGTGYYRPTAQGLQRIGLFPTYRQPLGTSSLSTYYSSVAAATLGCIPTPTRACLHNRRFQIEATYDATVLGGSAGAATPDLDSDQSLKFSFFDPTNLELFLKVIDGCSYNGHYWVFISGLTNAGVALQLTDKVTNAVYSYNNPAGQAFAPSLDIEAFACN